MKPIHSREQILEIAIAFAPTRAVGRVLTSLGATVFGGVNAATGFPGWLVSVVMKHRTWYLQIDVIEHSYRFSCPRDRPTGYDKLITREIL